MNPYAAIAVKALGAGGVAALLGAGVVSAASPSPSPTSTHSERHAVVRSVIESEADVLGIKPEQLLKDLKAGQKVSDLAKDKGMTKEQFAGRLAANLKPRLEVLVDHKVITQARADKILDRIGKGYVPFWDGMRRHRK